MITWKRKCTFCKKYFLQDQQHYSTICPECASRQGYINKKFSEGVLEHENKEQLHE